jgi:hypothetical protein
VTVPVISVGSDDADGGDIEIPLPEEEAPVEVAPRRAPRALAIAESPNERYYAMLGQLGSASVGELADAIGVSDSTALRALRELVAEKRVVRSGFARATRYRPREASARIDTSS